MGMFDYLTCDHPLPDGFSGDVEFQSKDTPAQCIENYRITRDGRLIERRVNREWVDDKDRFLGGYLREIKETERFVEIPHHGDIRFYCSYVPEGDSPGSTTRGDAPHLFREYVARFTNGRVEWIRGGVLDLADDEWGPPKNRN